ncbi:MAG TPA: hypothetical protein VGD98_22735 [Ktedonobacteraceae bacterium]
MTTNFFLHLWSGSVVRSLAAVREAEKVRVQFQVMGEALRFWHPHPVIAPG